MSSSLPNTGQSSKLKSENVTPRPSSTTYPIPPLAAIFLTYFHDTKGQTVLYYISNNETKLGKGNIEHTTLPSGLHLISEDLFGFRHGTSRPSDFSPVGELGDDTADNGGKGKKEKGKGDGTWPGVALFRSRENEGGRGRRMISLGVVLANPEASSQIFELKPWLSDIFDFIDKTTPVKEPPGSLSRLMGILDQLWKDHGCKEKEIPFSWRDGAGRDESRLEMERGLRSLARGDEVSDSHPIRFLPRLVDILGPLIGVVYKAAITGKRILIYSPPPLHPISAFGWCIAALSLPPSGVDYRTSEWLGQVGLMDLTALHAMKQAWVASTSDKILLSHTKLYDLSIDLSSCNPLPTDPNSNPDSESIKSEAQAQGQAIIHTTSPSSQIPIQVGYTFSDIPLYKLVSTSATTSDWWITFYDLFDRIYSMCAGVCEYAVGRGQVGISLQGDGRQGDVRGLDGEDESLLQRDDEVGNEEDEGHGAGNDEARRGQTILRRFYHHSYHLGALLDTVHTSGEVMTMGQVRELTGKWRVTGDEFRFWSDLARRWEGPQA